MHLNAHGSRGAGTDPTFPRACSGILLVDVPTTKQVLLHDIADFWRMHAR